MDQLWSALTADETPAEFPGPLTLAGLFIESMEPSFDLPGDEMSTGLFARKKLIHCVGVVGKAKLISTGTHPFTGIFTGSDKVMVRMSSAKKPVLGDNNSNPLTPGMGFKALRDGIDSANFVAMYGVNGQPGEWDFFKHTFKSHIAAAKGEALLLVSKKFATATPWIQEVANNDMATYGTDGSKVSNPVFPYMLEFDPHPDVVGKIPNTPPAEAMSYLDQLKGIAANSNFYDMYGWDEPEQAGGKRIHIGTL